MREKAFHDTRPQANAELKKRKKDNPFLSADVAVRKIKGTKRKRRAFHVGHYMEWLNAY